MKVGRAKVLIVHRIGPSFYLRFAYLREREIIDSSFGILTQ